MKKKKIKEMVEESNRIHKIWHSFCTYMEKEYYTLEHRLKKNRGKTRRKYKQFAPKKLFGYEAMCRAKKFTEKHPEILTVDCDDNWSASSDIFLIPHEGDKGYWGTTMLFMPQCTDEQNIICLYPGHLNSLIKSLQELQKRQRKNPWDNK